MPILVKFFESFWRVPLSSTQTPSVQHISSTPKTPQFNTIPSVPLQKPLSSTPKTLSSTPLSSTPKTPQFNTIPSVPLQKPLSSTHPLSSTPKNPQFHPPQFHTKNPSVPHQKTLSSTPLSCTPKTPQFHTKKALYRLYISELRGVCWTEGFLVLNWGVFGVELRGTLLFRSRIFFAAKFHFLSRKPSFFYYLSKFSHIIVYKLFQ